MPAAADAERDTAAATTRGASAATAPGPAAATQPEAVARACALLGDRWSLAIVAALLDGAHRYGEIRERLPAIAPNILSARLRALEDAGVLASVRYSERPPRFQYGLTRDGEELRGAALMLGAWAARRESAAHTHASGTEHERAGAEAVHEDCGSALELRWWCPVCGIAADAQEEQPILA